MDSQTPRQLLSRFYVENDLGMDGGRSSSSVRIEVTKNFHFYFPNFDARRKAVLKHDIHHLVTGYSASVTGESEISAWELASGCTSYPAAFFINMHGMMIGLPLNTPGVLRAFSRGRRTRNLYSGLIPEEQAMDIPVAELRSALLLDRYPVNQSPRFGDVIVFAGYVLFGVIYSVISLVLLPLILSYTVYIKLSQPPLKHPKT